MNVGLFEPSLGSTELEALARVLTSRWLGAGPELAAFTHAFAAHLGVPSEEVQSVSSCTEALFQVIAALDIGPGDEVVMPSISFVGAANAVLASGARVVLCDVDRRTLNPTCAQIEARLSPATKAIVLLHYGGHAGEVLAIADLARRRGIVLIEDAACALGSRAGGRACGTLGDVGLWSFDAMKLLTAGDGALCWIPDQQLRNKIARQTFLGIDAPGFAKARRGHPWWIVDPQIPGRRARMNDLSAALGLEQLRRLPDFLAHRARLAAHYQATLANSEWLHCPPPPPAGTQTCWYFYWIQCAPQHRDELAYHLLERGIYTTFRYWPVHRMTLYAQRQGACPGADLAADSTLLLPIHNGLTDAMASAISAAVLDFLPAH